MTSDSGAPVNVEDDEFDDLFNFTSPSTTSVQPVRASSPIQFGLDSDSSDSELDDTVQPATSSKNNTSLESSSYYEVSSSTGTSTPSTDGPKEGDTLITDNVNNLLGDTEVNSGLPLERQGEDDFQELDEGTRDFLDWLDKPKSSPTELIENKKMDSERSSNDDDLDFVDIHMPDKVIDDDEEENLLESENQTVFEEDDDQPTSKLPTVATILEKDETSQIQPEAVIPPVHTATEASQASHQFSSILIDSNSYDEEELKVESNIMIDECVEESDEDSSEAEDDIGSLFLTETNEGDEKDDVKFANISEAVRSPESIVQKHIMPFLKRKAHVSVEDRPWLWTKAICGKILSDVKSSSLADSFMSWDKGFNLIDLDEKDNFMKFGVDENFVEKLLMEVDYLADRVIESKGENAEESKESTKRELSSLLLFYYNSATRKNNTDAGYNKKKKIANQAAVEKMAEEKDNLEYGDMEEVIDNTGEEKDHSVSKKGKSEEAPKPTIVEWNSLIGPIAATLLSSSVSTPVASVMLSTIIPVAMPLVSLTASERLDAAKKIHSTFYLLVCYHLPMLVLHLDRYCPGWYWPRGAGEQDRKEERISDSPTRKGRNLEAQGIIPMTWFTSQLAGECIGGGTRTSTELKPEQLLRLWDILLTSNDHSLPFFLALRLFEKHSYKLLMLRGKELINELTTVMCFQETTTAVESLMGFDETTGNEDISSLDDDSVVDVWWDNAVSMRESTPISVVDDLLKAENNAVSLAFQLRRKEAMNQMKLRLEQEAEEHMAAVEEKRSMKEEEKQYEYYKNRLENFYKKHCPERVGRVDKVLKVYEGRYQILNDRLSNKYGSGFIPIFSPKLSMKTNDLVSTMGHGIRGNKKKFMATMVEKKTMELFGDVSIEQTGPKHQVAVNVDAGEILPFVTKDKASKSNAISQDSLKYYLVDSRTEEMAQLQGRFPTSARLSPDDLMDPDLIQQKIEMFEAFRGSVHICIMGEGFSSFPTLYGHPLSKREEILLDDDETRTNMCALFFIKRGFPFVSILDGGFAAAHAWLARDCTHASISSVLVDYDEELSLFAQLERSYRDQIKFANASTREKTTRVLQELIDRSMTRLTISENKIELLADTLRTEAGRREVKESVSKILKRSANQIKKGVSQVKRSNVNEEVEIDRKEQNINEGGSEKDADSGEGMTFKMRFAGLRDKNKDRAPKNDERNIHSDESILVKEGRSFKNPFSGISKKSTNPDETKLTSKIADDKIKTSPAKDDSNQSPIEKEGLSFKNPFIGRSKINMNIDQTKSENATSVDQTSSVKSVKKTLSFLSRPDSKEIPSEGHEPDLNIAKKNFSFRSFGEPDSNGKKKGFEFKKMNLPSFKSAKDEAVIEPTKTTALNFKRNPFAKKVTNADKDIDKAIAAALGSEEKPTDPKPGPLREKFVGFTKSASESIKDVARSTSQVKRPVISFNKRGSITRKTTVEEELISFDDDGNKSTIDRCDSI